VQQPHPLPRIGHQCHLFHYWPQELLQALSTSRSATKASWKYRHQIFDKHEYDLGGEGQHGTKGLITDGARFSSIQPSFGVYFSSSSTGSIGLLGGLWTMPHGTLYKASKT